MATNATRLALSPQTAVPESLELPVQSAFGYFIQRVVEIIIAGAVLIVTAPILLVVGLIIKLGTPGPVLFWQFRMGKDERPFRFVKFRTLYADARDRWPELYEYRYTPEQIENLTFKIRNDPRVSPQGQWLRKSTLDELPNFWNVLTGSMALVGPRPEIPEMLAYYQGEGRLKFKVRPGITGLAQISGRGRLSFADTVRLDLEYVRNRSLWLDLKLIVLTVYKIVTRDGAF
jgi:lipopolysaccharide/colanic/teichoic acid biosynthesis glycosyltransferase